MQAAIVMAPSYYVFIGSAQSFCFSSVRIRVIRFIPYALSHQIRSSSFATTLIVSLTDPHP